MTESLRDQLIKAGFKPKPKPKTGQKPPGRARKRKAKGAGGKGTGRGKGDGQGISLAAAYAAKEKSEQRDQELRKAEKMRLDAERRRQNDKLRELLDGKALNDPNAEIARHFQDGERITRIYVTPEQQQGLADGNLGIVKLRRRYWLVGSDIARQASAIKPDAVIDLSNEAGD